MSRLNRRMSGAPLLTVLGAWLAALVLLAPSVASAGLPYQVQWLFTQENPACEVADLLDHDGDPFFRINDTPLPTYQTPGALVTNADGSESNTANAEFDSVLLSTGANDFLFQITNTSGDNSCVHSRNVVSLISAPLGLDKPLFNVRRDGTAFVGNSRVDLSLAEINPPLARDIVNLETVIADNRAWLIDHASEVADLAAKLSLLQQLDTERRDLVTRPLDAIATIDLDAILDRYAGVVDAATKAALDQLLLDLKQSVLDLENELASLIDDFGAQADAVADLATQSAREAGFDPDDPASYALSAI